MRSLTIRGVPTHNVHWLLWLGNGDILPWTIICWENNIYVISNFFTEYKGITYGECSQ